MRKICVVITNRASYGRIKYLLKAIKEDGATDLQLIVSASTLLFRYGKAIDVIRSDGFEPDLTLYYILEGETLTTQAKSTGIGIIELSTAFEHLKPEMVITVADRFETMATAIATTYMNIPLVHIQGGELSGNIDDRVRHAITKLADFHFVATERAKNRVIQIGENPEFVFNVGCPSIDLLLDNDLSIDNRVMSKYGGVGSEIDWNKPFLLMLQHPVTTSYGQGFDQVNETLEALKKFPDYQKVVIWPNIDAGTDDVSKGIRMFRENNTGNRYHYFRNFSPEDYARVLNNAACCIGNSSSFIRENSALGTPSVIVGDRQNGREHGPNVVFCDYKREEIIEHVKKQIKGGKYPRSNLYGCGNAGKKIAAKLSQLPLGVIKKNNNSTINIASL